MTELSKVWSQVQWLHAAGVSLIPVRDKQEGEFLPKTPYRGWKQYQTDRIQLPDLWSQMDFHKTEAVAIIAGKVSGNLEIIDIDVKYKPGVDGTLLSDINNLYPDIYKKLRIHKTPSGGYHILYRISDGDVPGNMKLAGRYATPSELEARPKTKAYNFLETRGEGGYAVAPPSLGYTVHQDVTIPVLTWNERCSIINLCKSYSELSEPKQYTPSKNDSNYYDENPFEHYNKSQEAETILTKHGWKFLKQSNQFLWFTRPDKQTGISASFNRNKRVYYIFTSSTQFEESKGYNPATVLSILEHGGDRKITHKYLVQKGYGKLKPNVEKNIVKNNALSGRPLPPNVSAQAKNDYQVERILIQTTYPYGVFWERDDEGGFKISRERLYAVAEGLGFRYWQDQSVRIQGYIVCKQTDRQFFDAIKDYIKEEDGDEYIKICDSWESFVQRSGSFSITRLPYLNESQIVKDTSNSCYKFYNNGYLFITAQDISFNTYDTLSGIIWEESILPRSFNSGLPGGRYMDFLKLSTSYEQQRDHIHKCVGYLAHQYKDETTGYIVVLTEQCPDPSQGGGSGKNIFSSLLSNTTTYISIPGSQAKFDERFMQSWGGQRIFAVSDVPKHFDFGFLKELTTGSGLLKKLFKDEISVGVRDMPKFIIQTNFSYELSDGGLKRRIITIEFTDYFTKCGGVDVHFGCHFPNGWDLDDWTGYDNFVALCVKEWLSVGLKLTNPALTEGGWLKQFEQTWGPTIYGIISENFQQWRDAGWVKVSDFKSSIEDYYKENNTQMKYRPSSQKINAAIKKYAEHYGFQFLNNINHRGEDGYQAKHNWIGVESEAPF